MHAFTKSLRSSLRARSAVWFAIACSAFVQARDAVHLPVFIADNHAETFAWITREFDPSVPHQLVLVDAHSDASAAERSDEIREQLPRVSSLDARAKLIHRWRDQGRLQAYNWIEPLMPQPIRHASWLAGTTLSPDKKRALHESAIASLDGRLEVEPRSSGSFSNRWETFDLEDFDAWQPGTLPVILSIDLDFFAGMEPSKQTELFERIWVKAMDWPQLKGVAFAVSRPWLTNDEEALALVGLATAAVVRTPFAVLEVDATLDTTPDDSLRARQSSVPVPRWDAAACGAAIGSLWKILEPRLSITDRNRDWKPIMETWWETLPEIRIHADGGEADCDGIWRFHFNEAPILRILPPENATGQVRWHVLEPARQVYDVLPSTGLGKGFSIQPGRWIYDKSRSLATTHDFMLSPETWKPRNSGRIRISAEVETNQGWIPVPPIEVRLHFGSGFRASLSECMNIPYVFGIAGLASGFQSGADTGWGADCSNLLVHAWRRNGIPIRWGDPKQLAHQLAPLARDVRARDFITIREKDVERGIAIVFGNHVAALWEDREPVGKLTETDLVLHHLGGVPELIELGTLSASRPVFSLFTPFADSDPCRIKIAGDVVLAGDDPVIIDGFAKEGAHLFLMNLEGVPSMAEPERPVVYDFRFPAEKLSMLRERGVDAVSLANNHAGDAGRDGLMEGIQAIRNHGIQVAGAGANANAACQPWRVHRHGMDFAIFGISIVDCMIATETLPGVAKLPDHQHIISSHLRSARARGERCIVLLHGGDEYRKQVNDDQRRWSAWLASQGAEIIAGSHSHVVQRTEHHAGATITHSLGNAVYPKALKGADSGEVRTFTLMKNTPR